MIEVLVAVVVFSIGLIGIASMQATALRLTHDSQVTVRASSLAADILERIRLNPVAREESHYDDISGTQSSPACVTGNSTNTTSCTPAEIAQLDAWLWTQKLATDLPTGTGTVAFSNNIFTVTITWKELINGTPTNQTYVAGTYL